MLSRRTFLGLIAGGIACGAVAAPAVSARYRNISGLRAGRFVWNPSVTADGPLAIVVSLAERIVHVYRGGEELAFSTFDIASDGAAAVATGIFIVSAAGRDAAADGRRPLVWRGTDLLARGRAATSAGPVVRLPQEFAGLLLEATRDGALVVVTAERGGAQRFEAAGPFATEIETGSVDAPSVARFAKPEMARAASVLDAGRPGPRTTLVVSRADVAAHVLHDGRVVDRLTIAIEQPALPLGLHALQLLAPARSADGKASWLAFGLGDDAAAPHLAGDMAAAALLRVRFLERQRVAAVAESLQPGSTMILMDGPGPTANELPRTHVALLSDEGAAAAARSVATDALEPAARPPVEPVPAAGKRNAAGTRRTPGMAKVATGERPKRRGPPLDQREPWPSSMFWPF
jgi:hypothetical protein